MAAMARKRPSEWVIERRVSVLNALFTTRRLPLDRLGGNRRFVHFDARNASFADVDHPVGDGGERGVCVMSTTVLPVSKHVSCNSFRMALPVR